MADAILTVKHLNKSYGHQPVLRDVSFECTQGRIVGLVGANGAGKTTIMKAILGLLSTDGEIQIAGESMQFDHHPILATVGSLIEYPSLYPYMSGWDNLRLFADGPDAQARLAAVVFALNMTDYIHQKVRHYSLGMKQKLGVALAFLNRPQLVILDEPMNGLDPQGTKELRDFILKQKQVGVTFLISSHILSELQKLADDLVIIDHGKIIEKTTMTALLTTTDHFVTVKTDHDGQAKAVLVAAGYQVVADTVVKVHLAPDHQVADVLHVLTSHGLTVRDVRHEAADLESTILKLLATTSA